jgi:hypothetical protein
VTSRQTPEQWAVRVAEDVCALATSPGVDVA